MRAAQRTTRHAHHGMHGAKSTTPRRQTARSESAESEKYASRATSPGGTRTTRRRKERVQREREFLMVGIDLSHCCSFFTLAKRRQTSAGLWGRDFNHDHTIRAEVWHLVGTRIKSQWKQAEFWTVVEWAPAVGVHLHVVVRDAPELTTAWIEQVLHRRYPTFDVQEAEVWDGMGLANYLTKSLADEGWQRYMHSTSKSRGWIPHDLQGCEPCEH